MTLLYFVLGFLLLHSFVYGVDVYLHRHPLTQTQLVALARKRKRIRDLQEFAFNNSPVYAEPDEKSAMDASGEFISSGLAYKAVPARIAGLLKYKKHEWIAIVFVKNKIAEKIWWNKGADANSVQLALDHQLLRATIRKVGADTVLILHNHPNSFSRRYSVRSPSDADLKSAASFHRMFDEMGIHLLEFICERGVPYLYYAGFIDSPSDLWCSVEQLQQKNNKSVFQNRALQKELMQENSSGKIHGGELFDKHKRHPTLHVKVARPCHKFYSTNYCGLASKPFETACRELFLQSYRSQWARHGCYLGKKLPSAFEYRSCVEKWLELVKLGQPPDSRLDLQVMEGAGFVIWQSALFCQLGLQHNVDESAEALKLDGVPIIAEYRKLPESR